MPFVWNRFFSLLLSCFKLSFLLSTSMNWTVFEIFAKLTNIHRIALFTLLSHDPAFFIQSKGVLLNLKKQHRTPPSYARDHPSPPEPQNFSFCKIKSLNERFGHNKEKQKFVTESNAQKKKFQTNSLSFKGIISIFRKFSFLVFWGSKWPQNHMGKKKKHLKNLI